MPTQAEMTPLNRNERIYRAAPVEKYRVDGRGRERRPGTGVYRDYTYTLHVYATLSTLRESVNG